jgi:hypothetical protein
VLQPVLTLDIFDTVSIFWLLSLSSFWCSQHCNLTDMLGSGTNGDDLERASVQPMASHNLLRPARLECAQLVYLAQHSF